MRYAAVFAAIVIACSSGGALYEARSEAADTLAYPPPGQLIDVGGHALHINCSGTGSPTVVIDAGLGDWSTTWSLVQPEVAKTTRVCTYDRAGSGWSDLGPQPRTAAVFVAELHTLLVRADVPGPYVLVGHSMGGLTMQVFAAQHRPEVVGLLLVDSMSPGEPDPARPAVRTPVPAPFGLDFIARGLGHIGLARVFAGPLGSAPPELSPEAAGASLAYGVRPLHLQAFLDEFLGISESKALAAEVRSLGSMPVTVLSRAVAKSDATWQAQQQDLLRLSSNSAHIVSESSDHAIHLERPAEVVGAIAAMVIRVRELGA